MLSDDSYLVYYEETKNAVQPKAKIAIRLFAKPTNTTDANPSTPQSI